MEVVVVGGGPGGSTAAWRLARAGYAVTVLDAAHFPRVKLCAGWVTPAVWRALELAPSEYPHTLQPFRQAFLELDGSRVETTWPATASYGIVRREFDAHLLERAAAAGARVCEGARVSTVARAEDRVRIETTSGDVHGADVVIGAGGHHCPVARAFGEVSTEEAIVITRESETRLSAAQLRALTPRHGTPELFAEPDFRGYGWYFSKGDFLNVGLGCIGTGKDLHRRCAALVERLGADGRLPKHLALEPFRGHAYAVHVQAPRRVAGPGFLLIGDAAGLARGISGEGIGPAVESANLAARALVAGDIDAPAAYARALGLAFGTGEPGPMARWAERLPEWVSRVAARAVCRTPLLRRKLLFEGAFGMG